MSLEFRTPIVSPRMKRGVLCAALAALVGCSGPLEQPGGSSLFANGAAYATRLERNRSWMAPEAKRKDLLYISDSYGVHVFLYPSGRPVGDITGFAEPEGLCVDRAGDVFVTDNLARDVVEFEHGGTNPIAVLYDEYVDFHPFDCSVDPVTGNLAVASQDAQYVVIFPKAQQNPQPYSDPYASLFHCTYDDNGNLYADQVEHHKIMYIGVLARGMTTFKNFRLDRRVGVPSGIEWDGRHVAIRGVRSNTVFRMRFSGSTATVMGTTPLTGSSFVYQFWILGGKIIGPDVSGNVYFWKYPAGGSPMKRIGGFTNPVGSTVSVGA